MDSRTTRIEASAAIAPGALVPPRLHPGDLVAIATPSGAVRTPGRLRRGVDRLRALGFDVRVGPLAATADRSARTGWARADEVNAFITDPSVRAVFCAIGGYTSNGVLASLDYSALRADPKIILGYSDLTALLMAVYTQTGLICFHGPTVLAELGEFPTTLSYTERHLLAALTEPVPMGRLTAPDSWTEEFLAWDSADNRRRTNRAHPGWVWLTTGAGTGPLLGGNLDTLCALAGTPYFPDFTGAVFFWETTATALDPIERALNHLDLLGVFDRVVGMVVGRTFRASSAFEAELADLLRDRFARSGFPVVAAVDIGHTDPMLTLPIGARARLDSTAPVVEVLDACVR